MSSQKVHRLIAEYQKETGTHLPYRGKVHDIGPAVSHKAAIVTTHGERVRNTCGS